MTSANPSPLLDVAALRRRIDDPNSRIVDCRFDLADTGAGRREFLAAHIPGAVYFHLDEDLSAPTGPGRHPLPAPVDFAARLGKAGIGNEHTVVAYDAAGGALAARLWWMLRSLGHGAALVLDGGWQAWRRAGGPVAGGEPDVTAARFSAPPAWTGVVDRHDVRQGLGVSTLVDARAQERYRGEIEPLDPEAGHIPTAINLPYAGNLGHDDRFRPVAELRARFADLGGDVVAYCGSGVTACHNILAMEVAGIRGVKLYPGSWSDWSTAGETTATGDLP